MGYTQVSWDNDSGQERQPISATKSWAALTNDEKQAAVLLGYTQQSWDNESGLEQQPHSSFKSWRELTACGGEGEDASSSSSNTRVAQTVHQRKHTHTHTHTHTSLCYDPSVTGKVETTKQYQTVEPTIATALTTTTAPTTTAAPVTTSRPCKNWCRDVRVQEWKKKCKWKNCAGCRECLPPKPGQKRRLCCFSAVSNITVVCIHVAIVTECQMWCFGHSQVWTTKCTWLNICDGCPECSAFYFLAKQHQFL